MTLRDHQTHPSETSRATSLLVVTSPLAAVDGVRAAVDAWTGQRVLLSVQGAHDEPVDDDWVVIECHDPYVDVAHLLCRAMSRVRHLFTDLDGPFLFVGHPRSGLPAPDSVPEDSVRSEESADGELTLLAVGSAVSPGGLLGNFFATMEGHRSVDPRTMVDLLSATLGADRA